MRVFTPGLMLQRHSQFYFSGTVALTGHELLGQARDGQARGGQARGGQARTARSCIVGDPLGAVPRALQSDHEHFSLHLNEEVEHESGLKN